jgi:hypothetical protein
MDHTATILATSPLPDSLILPEPPVLPEPLVRLNRSHCTLSEEESVQLGRKEWEYECDNEYVCLAQYANDPNTAVILNRPIICICHKCFIEPVNEVAVDAMFKYRIYVSEDLNHVVFQHRDGRTITRHNV